MAGVQIENVEKSFGSVKVIRNVDIEAEDGEFVVLVGPPDAANPPRCA